jgi:hypothetical protein
MDSSQWWAAAVPWAVKARRMGCEGSRRGGSVVLRSGHSSQLGVCWGEEGRGLRVAAAQHSPTQRVKEVPDHSAPRVPPTGMPRRAGESRSALRFAPHWRSDAKGRDVGRVHLSTAVEDKGTKASATATRRRRGSEGAGGGGGEGAGSGEQRQMVENRARHRHRQRYRRALLLLSIRGVRALRATALMSV